MTMIDTEMNECNSTSTVDKIKKRDCYKLENDNFCVIHEIYENGVLCEIFTETEPYFKKPCDSRLIGMHKANLKHSKMMTLNKKCLSDIVIGIPLSIFGRDYSSSMVFITLVHQE